MSHFLPFSDSLLKYNIPLPANEDAREQVNGYSVDNGHESLEHVLDCMFPPRTWHEGDVQWRQSVSPIPATRNDSIAIQYQLDNWLQRCQAHETGVCSLRRHLYDNCFDEMIRQITINCIDQGLLLYRLRNEFRMTLKSYATIYESSVNFGLRQALRNEERVTSMQLQKDDILVEKQLLQDKLRELEKIHQMSQGKNEETLSSVIEKYEEKITKLNGIIERQKKLIEALNRKPIQL